MKWNMKWNKIIIIIGVFLIFLGIYSIAHEKFSSLRHEKYIDIGKYHTTIDKQSPMIRLPIILGVSTIICGLGILFVEIKRNYKKNPK